MQASDVQSPPPLIARGRERFERFRRDFRSYAGRRPDGRLLDFGAGAGGFLVAALEHGLDAHGVEIDPARQRQFRQLAQGHADRFVLYDGGLLPFGHLSFDIVYSWFVFEHVHNTWQALREIARVTKPGGFVDIHADDARNAWDGHVKIPWPPYMPRRFARAYLAEFGKEDRSAFLEEAVVYVTAPVIADMLGTLGFEILRAEPERPAPFLDGLYIASDEEARGVARAVRERLEAGQLQPPARNLRLVARKLGAARRRG